MIRVYLALSQISYRPIEKYGNVCNSDKLTPLTSCTVMKINKCNKTTSKTYIFGCCLKTYLEFSSTLTAENLCSLCCRLKFVKINYSLVNKMGSFKVRHIMCYVVVCKLVSRYWYENERIVIKV